MPDVSSPAIGSSPLAGIFQEGGYMVKCRRQGDVIIKESKIPDGLKKADDLILAEGELTGHLHRITKGQAERYVNTALGLMFLKVLSDFAEVSHEEHESIILPMGEYEITRQREWDWFSEETRRVSD